AAAAGGGVDGHDGRSGPAPPAAARLDGAVDAGDAAVDGDGPAPVAGGGDQQAVVVEPELVGHLASQPEGGVAAAGDDDDRPRRLGEALGGRDLRQQVEEPGRRIGAGRGGRGGRRPGDVLGQPEPVERGVDHRRGRRGGRGRRGEEGGRRWAVGRLDVAGDRVEQGGEGRLLDGQDRSGPVDVVDVVDQ